MICLQLTAIIRYDERGGAVIKNTLMVMFNYTPVTTSTSKPFTLEAYTTFVLIPYIAAWLIGEDLNTDVDGGWEAMQLGIDCGKRENALQESGAVLNVVFSANEKRH